MKAVVIRAVICVGIILLPILLLMAGKAENALYLIFPFLFGVPAMVLVALVLVPVERGLDRIGAAGWKLPMVPVVGGLVFMGGMVAWRFSMGVIPVDVEAMLLPFLLVNFGIGAGVGLLWRVSDWVFSRFVGRAAA